MEGIRNCPQKLVDVNQGDSGKDIEFAGLCTSTHKRKRRKKPDEAVLTCQVCGHEALGYNFNALTCEACKAFFRRNAYKKEIPLCCFAGKCPIDQRSRKLCSECRLNKCFEVGMKKEWILGTEGLKQRRRNKNRSSLEVKTHNSPKMMALSQPMTQPVMSLVVTPISNRMTQPAMSDEMMAMPQPTTKPVVSHKMMALSQPMIRPVTLHQMKAMSDQPMITPVISYKMVAMSQQMTKPVMSHVMTAMSDQPMIKPAKSFDKRAITDQPITKPAISHEKLAKSQPVTKPVLLHEMMTISKQLTNSDLKSDRCRVDDSFPATHWSYLDNECIPGMLSIFPDKKTSRDDILQPLSPELEADIYKLAETYKSVLDSGLTENNMKKVITKPCDANELFTMSEILIRNLVKFVKLLPDFKSIEQDDQVILLKESMIEVIVLRSALYFDPVNHKWKIKF